MKIEGASAIVTGGASGLGAATARLLAQRGMKVVAVDLNEDLGSKIAKEIGGKFCKADVSDEAQVQAAVDAASEHGSVARPDQLRRARQRIAYGRSQRQALRPEGFRVRDQGQPDRYASTACDWRLLQ